MCHKHSYLSCCSVVCTRPKKKVKQLFPVYKNLCEANCLLVITIQLTCIASITALIAGDIKTCLGIADCLEMPDANVYALPTIFEPGTSGLLPLEDLTSPCNWYYTEQLNDTQLALHAIVPAKHISEHDKCYTACLDPPRERLLAQLAGILDRQVYPCSNLIPYPIRQTPNCDKATDGAFCLEAGHCQHCHVPVVAVNAGLTDSKTSLDLCDTWLVLNTGWEATHRRE